MTYSFSTAIDNTTNLQDSTMWAVLIHAVNQRLQAAYDLGGTAFPYTFGGAAGGYNAPPWTVGAYDPALSAWQTSVVAGPPGTNIQLASWWSYDYPSLTPRGMQAAILHMVRPDGFSYFIDHRNTYEGSTTDWFLSYDTSGTGLGTVIGGGATTAGPNACWRMPALRTAAGLPVTLGHGAAPDNSLFRRLRYREITTTSDTADFQANPAADGQYAYMIGTGELYKYSGTAWVRANNHGADVLDNTLASPNAITKIFDGTADAFGLFQVGDIVREHLFQEVRCLVNLLRWTWYSPALSGLMTQTSHTYSVGAGSPASTVSWADAISSVAGGWAGDNTGGPNAIPDCFVSSDYSSSGPSWYLGAGHTDTTWTLPTLPTLTKEIDWMIYGDAPGGGVFDAQGDPLGTAVGYHVWHTDSAVSATSKASPQFGDATVFPPHPPPDPASNPDETLGYQVTDAVAICKYDVAGGFSELF